MNVLNRRGFFKPAVYAALAATTPGSALAFAVPQPQTTEPEMPKWWKRLVAEVEGLRDEAAPHMGCHEMIAISEERLNALFALVETANGEMI